jgi:hypothetical protein
MDAEQDFYPELPPPVAVAQQLVERSWADDLDDQDRLIIEQAARTIRRMMRRERVLKGLLREARRASP